MSSKDDGDRLKLLLLSEFFPPHVSGGAHARERFSKIAVDEGHEIDVFTPMIEGASSHEKKGDLEIFRPMRSQPPGLVPTDPVAMVFRLLYALYLFLYLPVWMKRNEVDAIHSTEHLLHPIAKFLGKLYRKPVVNFLGYTPSLYEEGDDSSAAFIFESMNLRFFMGDSVFCRTGKIKKMIEKWSRNPDVQVLHGILDESKIRDIYRKVEQKCPCSEMRDKLEIKKEEKMLVFAARLTPVKAPERAIELLSELPEDYRLVIVGNGPEMEDMKETMDSLGIEDRVSLVGEKTHEETLQFIACSDGVILTSKAEAYPTVVFEALAFNREVFSTPVGILKELEENNLYTSELSHMVDVITSRSLTNEIKTDDEILDMYSMRNYTETILKDIGDKLKEGKRGGRYE